MAVHTDGMNGAVTFTKASTKPAAQSTAQEGVTFIGCDVVGKILSLYQFLKDYLNHFGVLLTATVIVLACSLRGESITLQYNK